MRILGVDPGASHVGVSVWDDDRCTRAYETSPDEFARMVIAGALSGFDEVIAENYSPSGGYGNAKTGVETDRLLGLLVWVRRVEYGDEVRLVTRMDRAAARKRLVAAKQYRRASYGHGDHALDAEAVVVAGKRYTIGQLVAAQQ